MFLFKMNGNNIANTCKFAKHMKVEEQVKFLQNHKTGICVGTPARLMDLIDNGKFGINPSLFDRPQSYKQALT
jgi:protein CMS1